MQQCFNIIIYTYEQVNLEKNIFFIIHISTILAFVPK